MSFREFSRPLTAIPFAFSLREAPCGTLFHHSQVNADGLIQKVNLLIATGQNDLAMNRTMWQIARHYIKESKVPESILNRLEAGIRAFDPCLNCSTHAVGQMPLHLQLLSADGRLIDEAPWLTFWLSVTATSYVAMMVLARSWPSAWPPQTFPVRVLIARQLLSEFGADLAQARLVIFVDASEAWSESGVEVRSLAAETATD